MRPGAMLGDVNTLPDPERERPRDHGHVERHSGEHGLYMRRHVVRPLDIMNPLGLGGRETIERARKIGAYIFGVRGGLRRVTQLVNLIKV